MSQLGHCEGCDREVPVRHLSGKLCYRCRYRAKHGYPLKGPIKRRTHAQRLGSGVGNPQGKPPERAVRANPGSDRKIAELCERARLGLALWHKLDRDEDDGR